jgi:hypothetical protein
MFKILKRWWYYWKLGRKVKKNLQDQIERSRKMPPAAPPTLEQVEAFKKEWDLGWDSHMVTRVERKKTYYEADIKV